MNEHEPSCWFDDQVSFMPNLDSPNDNTSYHNHISWHPCKKETDQYQHLSRVLHTRIPTNPTLSLPHFDVSNKFLQQANQNPNNALKNSMMVVPFYHDEHQMMQQMVMNGQGSTLMTDWIIHDSHEDHENYLNASPHDQDHNAILSDLMQQDSEHQQLESTTSASTSTCPIDLWK